MNITRSRLWRWTKRVIAGIGGLILVLLLAGVVFQFVMTRIHARIYPAPGELVDVGGYSLHLYCTGEPGAPTVVMDSGLGGTMLDWQLVQPEIAKFTRVCTYDRGGMGWSDAGTQPRTSRQSIKELHTVLGNAGVRGPYVLVGHFMTTMLACVLAYNPLLVHNPGFQLPSPPSSTSCSSARPSSRSLTPRSCVP
jgi:pimeloyl-ACP methyl ester carboxylesterase